MKTDPNTSAFPHDGRGYIRDTGISKREYLIAAALTGFCAHPGCIHLDFSVTAMMAIKQADALLALLAELNTPTTTTP